MMAPPAPVVAAEVQWRIAKALVKVNGETAVITATSGNLYDVRFTEGDQQGETKSGVAKDDVVRTDCAPCPSSVCLCRRLAVAVGCVLMNGNKWPAAAHMCAGRCRSA
jgi:hypothetical protein